MLLKLRVTDGSNAGKEILVNKDKFLIGRADDCSLRPHSDAISRRHCVIIKTEKAIGVRDLKSRNGTVVNGEKITGDKRLKNGDTLEVGPLKFEVVIQKTEKKKATAKPKEDTPTKSSSAGEAGIGGMVSQWLEEADDVAREEQRMAPANETREYRFDETSRIEIDEEAEAEARRLKEEEEAKKKAEDDADPKAGSDTGKLPKFEVKKEQPKDTQEAAQMVLRKLFNRN